MPVCSNSTATGRGLCIHVISSNNPSNIMTFYCAHSHAATARLIFGGVPCQRMSRMTVGLGGKALPEWLVSIGSFCSTASAMGRLRSRPSPRRRRRASSRPRPISGGAAGKNGIRPGRCRDSSMRPRSPPMTPNGPTSSCALRARRHCFMRRSGAACGRRLVSTRYAGISGYRRIKQSTSLRMSGECSPSSRPRIVARLGGRLGLGERGSLKPSASMKQAPTLQNFHG